MKHLTLDGFLTVLALLAALYAVLSPVQRIRLSMSWRSQLILAVPASIAILAFELFDLNPPACPSTLGGMCRYLELGAADPGVPRKFAFLIAFAWLIGSVYIHRAARPTLRSLPELTQLATSLVDEEQYDDAIRLVEPHLELIAVASRRRAKIQLAHDRLKDFGPVDPQSFAAFSRPRGPGPHPYRGENLPDWAARPVRALATFVPAHKRAKEAASDMLQLLFHSNRLLDHIVDRRPHFGVALARLDVYGSTEFVERYLTRLIATPASALYQELAGNEISESPIGYQLPERNRLLHYLFSNTENAERLSVWKPIGDYVKRLLAGDERQGYWSHLNGDPGWFERERTSDPVWSAMFFFDIMITSAARHGIEYHMWLYYLPRFAGLLENGYDSDGSGIDKEAEFPTRAARLLYELFGFLTSWTTLYDRLPEGSKLRLMPDRHDRGSAIPHSAAIALGETLAIVMASERIDDGVIQTLHDVALRAIREIHDDGMRGYVTEAILRGGENKFSAPHLDRLADRFIRIDAYDQHEMASYADALNARLADTPRPRSQRAPF